VGTLRRVLISNIVCTNAASPLICSIIAGVPGHAIEDVKLSNILIEHQGGGHKDAGLELPEKEKDYPEPNMFGTTPAQGFFIRHVKGIEMNGVEFKRTSDDARPAFVLDDVQSAEFFRIRTPPVPDGPAFVLNNVRDFSIYKSAGIPDCEFEKVERKEL
jgi:hypothetical protein